MCDPDKKDSSDKTPVSKEEKKGKIESAESKKMLPPEKSLYSYVNSLIQYVTENFKKYYNSNLMKPQSPSEPLKLISSTEKLVKDYYGEIVKKVKDFAQNNLQKVNTVSKEEAENSKKILLQYAAALEKISEENLKKITELKEQLQTKIFKMEELHSVRKFLDDKVTEVKKLSEEITKSLSKKEFAPFVKDLQEMVESQSNTLKSSLNSLFDTAKGNIPKLQKSINVKDTLSKMPTSADVCKILLDSLNKMCAQKYTGYVNSQDAAEIIAKKSRVLKK